MRLVNSVQGRPPGGSVRLAIRSRTAAYIVHSPVDREGKGSVLTAGNTNTLYKSNTLWMKVVGRIDHTGCRLTATYIDIENDTSFKTVGTFLRIETLILLGTTI